MMNILCVHQGTEKYGSDKSFVGAVSALQTQPNIETHILLPGEGEIDELIEDAHLAPSQTRYLWILRKAGLAKAMTLGLPRNFAALFKAVRDLKRYDLVYVNTAVIFDFLLASIISRRRVIVHVREIPVGIAMTVIRRLIIMAKSKVIFNSQATAKAFRLPENQEQAIVYNGFEMPSAFQKEPYDGIRPLRLLCIGRLNAWKGQEVLVRACALLPEELRDKVSVRIVGGVYKDQTHFRTNLENEIKQAGLQDTIVMQDFVDDPAQEYINADVVVVPSTLPEPFGRVAIEGMAYGCAVIATDHGGLSEIVVQGKTGTLVEPNDPNALANAIKSILGAPDTAQELGLNGQERFQETFTQESSDAQLTSWLFKQIED